jgi:oligoendopeptidase F
MEYMKNPKQKVVQREWNFKLFYKSAKDPQIEKDVQIAEGAYKNFAEKYKDATDYLNDANELFTALTDYENLEQEATSRPIMYWNYIKDTDSGNTKAEAEFNKLISRYTNAGNQVIFFMLRLGKITTDKQKEFLNNAKLAHFHYFLKCIFDTAQYDLTEAEEKILSLISQPSRNMWIDGVEKMLSKQSVKFKGKQIPVPEAFGIISGLPVKERRKLHVDTLQEVKKVADFAEAEINAVYTDKKIRDELRGLKEPYDATIIGYQNDPKIIERLVETVTKYFTISQRFYKLKAKILKEKTLTYADRSATAGSIKMKFDLASAKKLTEKAFHTVDPKFSKMFNEFFERGQVDVFSKKGKKGGAYCSSNTHTPTMVLLNHTNDIRSVTTLAHEMGHAFHSELSKSQTPLYQHYTTSVAEVASTLFENFVFDEIFEKLNDKEKIVALHNQINDDIATIFRQIACFNYEYDLHKLIRTQGAATKEEMAKLMNKHMSAYLGPVMKLHPDDGYFFVQWSHIRNFFYVYSYAFGQIISKALYAEYKKDKTFINKIEQFLKAGGSKSPYDIFMSIGIDTSKPDFFESGLKQVEEDIKRLEKLVSTK